VQSPRINKIAKYIYENLEENHYSINVTQKNKLNKNKVNQNKSIIKPSILNQPKTKLLKQQKKEIRDKRRRAKFK